VLIPIKKGIKTIITYFPFIWLAAPIFMRQIVNNDAERIGLAKGFNRVGK
jgi:hypothetical protein